MERLQQGALIIAVGDCDTPALPIDGKINVELAEAVVLPDDSDTEADNDADVDVEEDDRVNPGKVWRAFVPTIEAICEAVDVTWSLPHRGYHKAPPTMNPSQPSQLSGLLTVV